VAVTSDRVKCVKRNQYLSYWHQNIALIDPEAVQLRHKPYSMLITGDANSGKTIVPIAAYLTLDDESDFEQLRGRSGQTLNLTQGQYDLNINSQKKQMVFAHDSLSRLRQSIPEQRSQFRDGGILICTAITQYPLTDPRARNVYYDFFEGPLKQFDQVVDVRSTATFMRRLTSRSLTESVTSPMNTATQHSDEDVPFVRWIESASNEDLRLENTPTLTPN